VQFGLSMALYGGVDLRAGRVQQSNFHDQPQLRLAQAPVVETVILPSIAAPEGVGEPVMTCIAPAVANALAVLTGRRWRSLPLAASTGPTAAAWAAGAGGPRCIGDTLRAAVTDPRA